MDRQPATKRNASNDKRSKQTLHQHLTPKGALGRKKEKKHHGVRGYNRTSHAIPIPALTISQHNLVRTVLEAAVPELLGDLNGYMRLQGLGEHEPHAAARGPSKGVVRTSPATATAWTKHVHKTLSLTHSMSLLASWFSSSRGIGPLR